MKEGFFNRAKEGIKKVVKTGALVGMTGAAAFAAKETKPLDTQNKNSNLVKVEDINDQRLKAYNDSNELYIKYRDHVQSEFNLIQTPEAEKESHELMSKYIENIYQKLDEKDVEVLHKYGVDCKVDMPLDVKNSNYIKNESLIKKEMRGILFKKIEENEKITSVDEKDHLLGRINYLFTCVEFIRPDPNNKPLTQFDFKEIDSSFQERGIKPISWDEKEKKITTNRKYVVLGEYGEMWLGGEVSDDKTYTRIIYSPKFREPSIKVVLNENLKNGKEIIGNKIKETQNTPAPKVEVIKNDTQEISDTTNIEPDIKKENFRNPNQKLFFQGYRFREITGQQQGYYSIEEVNKLLEEKGFEPISDESKPQSYFNYEIKKKDSGL